jgi:L-iditol 2-dehydrogenase
LQVIDKELDVVGVFRYANVYADAVRLVASGRISVQPLVTHRFPLTETAEALRTAGKHGGSAVKVIVQV